MAIISRPRPWCRRPDSGRALRQDTLRPAVARRPGRLTPAEAGTGSQVTAVGITYQDIDLASRLGVTLDPANPDMRVVLYSNGQTNGAMRVEAVIGMIEVEREECRPLPSHFQHEERTWISGTTMCKDELVLILTPEWVLGELGKLWREPPDNESSPPHR